MENFSEYFHCVLQWECCIEWGILEQIDGTKVAFLVACLKRFTLAWYEQISNKFPYLDNPPTHF